MRPQLIVDCGGRVLSALLVTADGDLVPCSQEIRQLATRYLSNSILFEPRVAEDRELLWDEALETLAKTTPRTFFQRARRIGLRRPWDPQASAEALQLASPLTVLSSASALADRSVSRILPAVGLALLDAILETAFAFVAERQLVPADVDPVLVLPAQTGRPARLMLQKLFRRRGFRRLTVVRREIAAAMALVDQSPCECLVVETSEHDLHLHRVVLDKEGDVRQFRTATSMTFRGLGWSHWVARTADALRVTPSAAFDRSLTALLTGSPESLPPRVTHAALESVLDDPWSRRETELLREVLTAIGANGSLPVVFAGEIFTLDAVRRLFGHTTIDAPVLDSPSRSVARALRSRVTVLPSGTLRVNTFHGETVALIAPAQLPAPGESSFAATDFRFAGDGAAGKPFLIHLLWGTDSVPEGNATLCALPLELRGENELRLTVQLRRSASGRRLHGTVEARIPRNVVAARARFTEELEVTR